MTWLPALIPRHVRNRCAAHMMPLGTRAAGQWREKLFDRTIAEASRALLPTYRTALADVNGSRIPSDSVRDGRLASKRLSPEEKALQETQHHPKTSPPLPAAPPAARGGRA